MYAPSTPTPTASAIMPSVPPSGGEGELVRRTNAFDAFAGRGILVIDARRCGDARDAECGTLGIDARRCGLIVIVVLPVTLPSVLTAIIIVVMTLLVLLVLLVTVVLVATTLLTTFVIFSTRVMHGMLFWLTPIAQKGVTEDEDKSAGRTTDGQTLGTRADGNAA